MVQQVNYIFVNMKKVILFLLILLVIPLVSSTTYTIQNCTALYAMSSSNDYVLDRDIDCAYVATSGITGFSGNLNCMGYTIKHLNFTTTTYSVGFIKTYSVGTIQRCGFEDAYGWQNYGYDGMIVGKMTSGTIQDVWINGTYYSTASQHSAPIVGDMDGGTIQRVFSRMTMWGSGTNTYYGAGIASSVDGGTLNNSIYLGNFTGTWAANSDWAFSDAGMAGGNNWYDNTTVTRMGVPIGTNCGLAAASCNWTVNNISYYQGAVSTRQPFSTWNFTGIWYEWVGDFPKLQAQPSSSPQVTWWNKNWSYFKPITLTGPIPSNYTIQINVSYVSGKMNADFSDIRFIGNNNITNLSYWNESQIASNSATFWVNVPSNATIFMYYGNSNVGTTSNINNTFLFADDFSSPNLDANKWGTLGTITYSMDTVGGTLNITSGSWGNSFYSLADFEVNTGQELRYRMIKPGNNANVRGGLNNGTASTTDGGVRTDLYHTANTGQQTYLEAVTTWFFANQEAQWYSWALWNDGTNTNGTAYNATGVIDTAQGAYNNANRKRVVLESGTASRLVSFDWIFLRNRIANDGYSFGVENAQSTSTCTYSGSGNWNVLCSDNCSITSNVALGINNFTLTGTGSFVISIANITGTGTKFISGTDSTHLCNVYCLNGGCFK